MNFFKVYTIVTGVTFVTIVCWFSREIQFKDFKKDNTTQIFSSEGNYLGTASNESNTRREWTSISQFPNYIPNLVLKAEDQRFWYHKGLDLLSIGVVLKNFISNKDLIRGASTITMQLVRIQNPWLKQYPSIFRKAFEVVESLRYELWLSKNEILEAYLNSISIRSNVIGFPAASKYYFHKHIRFLSLEEAASLTVLLRENQPSKEKFEIRLKNLLTSFSEIQPNQCLDKDDLDFNQKHPTLNCENYDSILVALGFKQKLNTYSNVDNTSESKHFLNWIKTILSNKEDEFTSHLSSDFNSRLNLIVNSELMGLQKWNVSNASLIVFKVDSQKKGKIRLVGMIGSKNFYEDGNGQVNGSLAFRDAGSTLKPLLYAYGIEKGLFSINSIVNDEKKVFPDYDGSSYLPRNADLNYWGQLTLAEALANSRNIPAVEAITKISVVEFLKFLHRSGFQHLKETPHHYGPGLALGAGGASLFQLTRAYGTFVSEGILPEVELGESNRTSVTYGKQQRLFSKETAEEIKSVLSDKNLRQRAFGKRSYLDFPFPVSIKTGTSKDYRNSWAIGFNEDYIVGAWVGNFSGEKTMDVSGSFGAGRIVQNTFRFLVGKSQKTQLSFTSTEPKAICKLTGKIANSTCHSISLRVGKQKKMDTCSGHSTAENRFLSPTSGQVYLLHPGSDLSKQEIPIRIFGSVKNSKLIWNEKQSFDLPTSGEMRLPIVRGKHKLELFEENKKTSIVHFEVI